MRKGGAANLLARDLAKAASDLETKGKTYKYDDAMEDFNNLQHEVSRIGAFASEQLDMKGLENPSKKENFSIQILVVDDSKTMRKILVKYLEQQGYNNIITSINGQDALEKLKENKCDLIISDFTMPKMNGLELLKHVRKSREYKYIPFLMVTAEGLRESIHEAIKEGVTGYINKPVKSTEIADKIHICLRKKIHREEPDMD